MAGVGRVTVSLRRSMILVTPVFKGELSKNGNEPEKTGKSESQTVHRTAVGFNQPAGYDHFNHYHNAINRFADMSAMFPITTIDCRQGDARELFRQLREKLSPRRCCFRSRTSANHRTVRRTTQPTRSCPANSDDVRSRGLDAVLHYTSKLDRRDLTPQTIRVTPEELATAAAKASPEFLATIRQIRDNVAEFQKAVLPHDVRRVVRSVGNGTVELRQRHLPMKRVGVCVPGGAAAYPSTVLMTAVPAMTAGVREKTFAHRRSADRLRRLQR